MLCNHCGDTISEDDKFCSKCGKKTPKDDGQETGGEQSDSYLAMVIRTKYRRRLGLGYLIIVMAIGIFIYQQNFIANLVSGPREMSGEALESELTSGNIKNLNINLRLQKDQVYQSGYTYVTKTVDQTTKKVERETTDHEYYLTIIGKHVLVLEGSEGRIPSGNFEGAVTPLSPELQAKLAADFNSVPELSKISNSILPYSLSNNGMTGLDSFWLFVLGVILACWGGYLVCKELINDKKNIHYAYKIAKAAGYQGISGLSYDFETDIRSKTIKIGSYKMSDKFLFRNSFFSFEIYPLSEMYWAYKKVIRKSVNFVPTGKMYQIVMNFRPSLSVSITEPERKVDQHLSLLVRTRPNAKFGYRS